MVTLSKMLKVGSLLGTNHKQKLFVNKGRLQYNMTTVLNKNDELILVLCTSIGSSAPFQTFARIYHWSSLTLRSFDSSWGEGGGNSNPSKVSGIRFCFVVI